MAEAMFRARMATRAPEVTVGSVGLVFDGRPAEPRAVDELAKRDIDLSEHRSQILTPDLLTDAELILGMERMHIREVVTMDVSLFNRSFTLPELATLGREAGPRPDGTSLRDWAEHIGAQRSPAEYATEQTAQEIPDPFRRSRRTYRKCASLIETYLDEVIELAWPPTNPSGTIAAPATSGGIHADRDRR